VGSAAKHNIGMTAAITAGKIFIRLKLDQLRPARATFFMRAVIPQ
jgi:hypothetical protein